jgi:HTH-type transcriptional regulator / antitoxin HigA
MQNMTGLMRLRFRHYKSRADGGRDSFQGAVKENDMDIKPIRTEADYEAALKEVERLWGADPGTPDGDHFEVLFTLVESYEDQQYPILPPDPIEAIKYYMDSRGLDRQDLERYIGPSGRVSEVLSRKRPLTLVMIRKLNAGLGIPAEVLIQRSKS